MEKNTQTKMIVKYMMKHKNGITSKIAFELFGATRLSGIIWNLRHQGYVIEATNEQVTTRYGGTTIVARYKLIECPKKEVKFA